MRFSNLPWNKIFFKDIANFSKGNGLSKDLLSNKGIKCILYGELYTKYIPGPINKVISKTTTIPQNPVYSKKNDIILPASGESNLDISTACCLQEDNILLGGDLNIIRVSKHDGSFICYQLIGKRKFDVAKIAQGASIVHLHNSDLEKLKLFIPPSLADELKISSLLNVISERIVTQKKIINKIKSLIISIKNTEFYNTKGFKEKLENILIEINEKTIINNQHAVLSSTVKGIFKQSDYFDRAVASENNIGYKIVKRGNIVVSPQNLWMGNISYNDKFDIGIVSPSYKIFNISSNYNERYIFEMLTTKKSLYLFKTVSEQGASIVRRNLNYEAFMQLTFNIPSLNEQNNFIEKLSLLQNKLSLENKILSLLEQQKQYLLDKLFI